MNTIQTSRLLLLPHSAESLRRWKISRSEAEKFLGIHENGLELEDWVLHELVTAFDPWIENIEKHPGQSLWYAGFEIVLRENNCGIGGIGFAGEPDKNGEVLVGYHLDKRYRGKGLAAEALNAVTNLAFSFAEVKSVAATIPTWNHESVKLAVKCGFEPMEETVMEGMEIRYFRRFRP